MFWSEFWKKFSFREPRWRIFSTAWERNYHTMSNYYSVVHHKSSKDGGKKPALYYSVSVYSCSDQICLTSTNIQYNYPYMVNFEP